MLLSYKCYRMLPRNAVIKAYVSPNARPLTIQIYAITNNVFWEELSFRAQKLG